MYKFLMYLFICLSELNLTNQRAYPIVLWHGVGDYYDNSFMMKMKYFLKETIRDVRIISIHMGHTEFEDFMYSYTMSIEDQIKTACRILRTSRILRNGYNGIGFSQGALLFRGTIQKCSGPPIKNFISVGGPHEGVYGIPSCSSDTSAMCDLIRRLASYIAYTHFVQQRLVQAQYWHDPVHENIYKKKSSYLSDINNELIVNETYKNNLLQLKNLVLVKFLNDTTVYPAESEWFGFYKSGQGKDVYTLNESSLYIEDRLGLRKLDELNKLHFLALDNDHMRFNFTWFYKNLIKPFLLE